MSDNVPLRTQRSCTEDEYYMIDVFSYARPATNGGTGSLKQLVMYITRALEDSGRLDLLQERLDQDMINVRSVYSNSFRWRKTQGAKLIARLIMGDFRAEREVERRKLDQMKLAENFVFTMPKSDASIMTVKAVLVNESQEIILETGELDMELLTFQGETRAGVEHEHRSNQPIEQDA